MNGTPKPKPIWFSTTSMMSILAGRKRQTRRVLKPQPPCDYWFVKISCNGDGTIAGAKFCGPGSSMKVAPRYQRGDVVYWANEPVKFEDLWSSDDATGILYGYLESKFTEVCSIVQIPPRVKVPRTDLERWPGRCLPIEWAHPWRGRITGVRAERLQDISDADSLAEGFPEPDHVDAGLFAREWFIGHWDRINGKGSWEKNPWVWVYEFETLPSDMIDAGDRRHIERIDDAMGDQGDNDEH